MDNVESDPLLPLFIPILKPIISAVLAVLPMFKIRKNLVCALLKYRFVYRTKNGGVKIAWVSYFPPSLI
jgi:hypothetical protein